MKSPDTLMQGLVVIWLFNSVWLMGFTEWLSYVERAKGTFFWLRTLPVSDQMVVTAKFVTNLFILTISFFPSLIILSWYAALDRILIIIGLWLALVSVGSFMLFTKLVLSRRLGPTVPLMVVLLGLLGWSQLSKRAPDVAVALAGIVMNPFVLISLELLSILFFWFVMWQWIAARDTYRLID
jgi:hypothetical protein